MQVQEGYSQDRLAFIVNQLNDIDNNLEEYFKNYNTKQLSQLILKEKQSNEFNGDLNDDTNNLRNKTNGRLKKQEYLQIVEICNQLWVVNGLVNEFNHQIQFENKVQSYIKLNSKVNDIKKKTDNISNSNSIKIFNELDDKIKNSKIELIQQADKIFDNFFVINNESLQINYLDNELELSKFLRSCKNLNNNNNNNNNNDDESYFNFIKIFNNWIQKTLNKLDEGFLISVEDGDDFIKLHTRKGESNFFNFINSIEEIIKFFNEFIDKYKLLTEFKNIKINLSKIILKFIKLKMFSKENVYPLIIDKLNYEEISKGDSRISTISKLYKVSKSLSFEGWSKDGICELEFWIDDLTSSWVDNLLDYTIDELKLFVISIDNNEKIEMLNENNLIKEELNIKVSKEDEQNDKKIGHKRTVDEWGDDWNQHDDWNEDDKDEEKKEEKTEEIVDDGGWGDIEDELDLEEEDNDDEEKSIKENNFDEEDDWGAWGDEVKIDDDIDVNINTELAEQNGKIKPFYKYSKLVNEVMDIFAKYMNNYEEFQKLKVNEEQIEEAKDLFKHGFKKLCISFFMMLESDISETYRNDILFYNDYNKILEECYIRYEVDLTTCFKMNSRFINSFMSSIYDNLYKIIEDYDRLIWSDNHFDNEEELKKYENEFLVRYNKEFEKICLKLQKLSNLNSQLIINTFITIIFRSFNCLCDKILNRKDISSIESEILSEMIDIIIKNTIDKIKFTNIIINKIQSFNKLEQIKFILSSNLKSILDLFYDAKLYEIETHELISLIQSLFIESPQRIKAISEIKNFRELLS